MPPLDGATGWLNSPPLTTDGLRGQVVIVDFWTYTCINWLRTVPYVRAWAAAYREAGAVVLGVHTPEFPFERDIENVRRAVEDRDVTYPVVLDGDYAIWTAFSNMYWPALYLVDAQGTIRYHHFGEGAYEESEAVIRQLLGEAGAPVPGPVTAEARGIEAAADWDTLRTAETYLGYERADAFASPGAAHLDTVQTYVVPDRLRLGEWALAGNWSVRAESVAATATAGRLAVHFHARDVNLVMGLGPGADVVPFRVLIDGRSPDGDGGNDVDGEGLGTVTAPRLYQLVRQQQPIADRTFEIEFLAPGVEAFAFTFG